MKYIFPIKRQICHFKRLNWMYFKNNSSWLSWEHWEKKKPSKNVLFVYSIFIFLKCELDMFSFTLNSLFSIFDSELVGKFQRWIGLDSTTVKVSTAILMLLAIFFKKWYIWTDPFPLLLQEMLTFLYLFHTICIICSPFWVLPLRLLSV